MCIDPVATGNSPKDRLLSSKEHELREMYNKFIATTRRLQEVERENKTLNRLQVQTHYILANFTFDLSDHA